MKVTKKLRIITILVLVSFLLISCKKDNSYITEEIIIKTGSYKMDGILTIPNNDATTYKAVILLGGSGPTDMNSSVNKLKPFKDIAEGLAKEGIASIRFNKRTYQYQKSLGNKYDFTPQDEYIDDCLQATMMLVNDPRIDNEHIYLIGHSQGGQFAPLIANRTDKLKGIIIMAGTTAHILDLLMEQIYVNNGIQAYNEYMQYYKTATSIDKLDTNKLTYAYFGAYYQYWYEYNKYDFANELIVAASTHKILVMQGEKDLQVYKHHFDTYKELLGEENATFKLFSNLNHMFVYSKNENINNAYTKKGNVDIEVIKTISDFILN